jgi:hypothetical protein
MFQLSMEEKRSSGKQESGKRERVCIFVWARCWSIVITGTGPYIFGFLKAHWCLFSSPSPFDG